MGAGEFVAVGDLERGEVREAALVVRGVGVLVLVGTGRLGIE